MAGVNGIGIKVGQVWRQRDGRVVRVARKETSGLWGTVSGGDVFVEMADIRKDGCCAGNNTDYDLIELVQDENGFTIWRGGECPVPSGALVIARFQDGYVGSPTPAYKYDWQDTHLVAYKLVEQPTVDAKDPAADMLSDLGWHFDGTTWVQDDAPATVETPDSAPTQAPYFTITGDGWGKGWTAGERLRLTDIDMNERGYESLADVLQRAYDQAAKGKGKERHARGEPFTEQVMQQGAQRFGVGSLLFQAFKKSEESQRLPQDRAINELLGSIVYLAGAVIALEKGGAK